MPKPKPTNVVCDTCGLDWKQHKPTPKGTVPLSECVRLLKAEVAKPRQHFFPYISQSASTGGNFTSWHLQ